MEHGFSATSRRSRVHPQCQTEYVWQMHQDPDLLNFNDESKILLILAIHYLDALASYNKSKLLYQYAIEHHVKSTYISERFFRFRNLSLHGVNLLTLWHRICCFNYWVVKESWAGFTKINYFFKDSKIKLVFCKPFRKAIKQMSWPSLHQGVWRTMGQR